jgi:hypothetical protein
MRSRNNSDAGGSGGRKRRKKHVEKKEPTDGLALGKCQNCGKKGHWAKDCWSKPKKGKAHVAQTEEEEEPSLFLVSVGDFSPIPLHQNRVAMVKTQMVAWGPW